MKYFYSIIFVLVSYFSAYASAELEVFHVYKVENSKVYIDTNDKSVRDLNKELFLLNENKLVTLKFSDLITEDFERCGSKISRKYWRYNSEKPVENYGDLIAFSSSKIQINQIDRNSLKLSKGLDVKTLNTINSFLKDKSVELKNCKMYSNSEFKKVLCEGKSFLISNSNVLASFSDNGYDGSEFDVSGVLKFNNDEYYIVSRDPVVFIPKTGTKRIIVQRSKSYIKC